MPKGIQLIYVVGWCLLKHRKKWMAGTCSNEGSYLIRLQYGEDCHPADSLTHQIITYIIRIINRAIVLI
jgi:hypothetical protein